MAVVADEPEARGEDEFSVDFDESGEELDEHAIHALLDGIYDADSSTEEDAIAQFDDFVAEVVAAPAATEFDGIYEHGGSYLIFKLNFVGLGSFSGPLHFSL